MKTIILDGSNIIRRRYLSCGQNPDFSQEAPMESQLVQMMSQFREDGTRVEIYFDGPKRSTWHKDDCVEVFFSGHKKADDLIVNTVAELAENYGQEVAIITQDYQLQQRCKAYGADVITTHNFWQYCQNYYEYETIHPAWAQN